MKFGTIIIHSDDYIKSRTVGGSGITYLASYLDKYMGDVDTFLELEVKKLIERKPDVVGISTVTQNYPRAIEFAKSIKEHLGNIPILVGGPHITNLPSHLPKYIDVGVQSEGEETLLELIKIIKNGDFENKDRLKKVLGISYHGENNEVIINKSRPLINNLDSIPLPKFSILNQDYGFKYSIYTSRGCPYRCSFCSSTKMWNRVRLHSAERILEEIEFIMKHYPEQDFIGIGDDLFTISLPRLRKIVELIREQKIHKKIKFTASVKASNFDEETIYLLKKMNVSTLFFGFESGDERVLKNLKQNASLQENINSINFSENYGMRIHGSFLLASPTETKQEIARTYWFISSYIKRMERLIVTTATPFPNTDFWNFAKEEKIITDDFDDWEGLSIEYDPDKSVFLNKFYTKDEYTNYFSKFKDIVCEHNDSTVKNINDFYFHYQLLKNTLDDISAYFKNKTFSNVLEISNQNELLEDYLHKYIKIRRIQPSEIDTLNKNKKFDGIFLIHTLEQIKNPKILLKKLENLLAYDGYIIIIVHNAQNHSFVSKIAKGSWDRQISGISDILNINHYSANKLTKLINMLGLKIVDFRENFKKSNNKTKIEEELLSIFSKYIDKEELIKNTRPNTYTIILKK